MDPIIKKYTATIFDELSWCEKEEIIYQTDMTKSVDYTEDYFDKYVKYENTDISKKLNNGRTTITSEFCESILDIGVGSGEFIKNSKIKTFGFDINPKAIDWLKSNNIFIDPYQDDLKVDGLSFWDSLEHIPNPNALLSKVLKNQYVFISIPIFKEFPQIKNSKHYRPNEHYYYFTSYGLIHYMKDSGFNLIKLDDFETKAGREEILTFVFIKN